MLAVMSFLWKGGDPPTGRTHHLFPESPTPSGFGLACRMLGPSRLVYRMTGSNLDVFWDEFVCIEPYSGDAGVIQLSGSIASTFSGGITGSALSEGMLQRARDGVHVQRTSMISEPFKHSVQAVTTVSHSHSLISLPTCTVLHRPGGVIIECVQTAVNVVQ